jgi:hypothetical protein
MNHLVLLGDSILDNRVYVNPGPDVTTQLRSILSPGWQVTLLAVDGSVAADVPAQLARLPGDATHLVLSVGGNDALLKEWLLRTPVETSAQAYLMLADSVDEFERKYRKTVDAALAPGKPLLLCTVYNGNFLDPVLSRCARLIIAAFDDTIIRVAVDHHLTVIDLRSVCSSPSDYANDIEPSVQGGSRIAAAIGRTLAQPHRRSIGATICGAERDSR